MMLAGIRLKELGRSLLGDGLMSSLHALRFYYRNVSGRSMHNDIALATVDRHVGEGDIVVDVGANNANWSYRLARIVGPGGKVFAFEPHPYYAAATEKTLRLHRVRNVRLLACGLAEAAKTALLQHVGDDGRQLSGRSFIARGPKAETSRTIEIKLEKLDALAQHYPELEQVKLIKIDAEGFEYFVVKGALELLGRAKPLIIAETGHAQMHDLDEDALFRLLQGCGYQAFSFEEDGSLRAIDRFADIQNEASKDVLFAQPAGLAADRVAP